MVLISASLVAPRAAPYIGFIAAQAPGS
jgi:hypothetical protein